MLIGQMQQRYGKYEEAEAYYQQALNIFQNIKTKQGITDANRLLGEIYQHYLKYDEAEAFYKAALDLSKQFNELIAEANTLTRMGEILQYRKEYELAKASYENALHIYKKVDERLGMATCLAAMSTFYIGRDPERSRALFEQAIALHELIGARYDLALDLHKYGKALLEAGRCEEALSHMWRSRDLFEALGIANWVRTVDELIARAEGGQA